MRQVIGAKHLELHGVGAGLDGRIHKTKGRLHTTVVVHARLRHDERRLARPDSVSSNRHRWNDVLCGIRR